LAGAVVDLNVNELVVDYAGPSVIASVIADLLSGRIEGASEVGGLPTFVGIAEAADLGLTEFAGFVVDETAVVLKVTYVGDANLDGQVDALDYERIDLAIGNSGVLGVAAGDGRQPPLPGILVGLRSGHVAPTCPAPWRGLPAGQRSKSGRKS
jgi:hypothetical protein